jgi:GTP-binding protein
MDSVKNIRNVAIIAHVDHGKTTLVDQMLKTAKVFSDHQEVEERVLDRHDLEKERGITIFSKNCSLHWKGVRINLIDTPGHADFGGEVERVLRMADAALILACAHEGPMPQTRFVLQKAMMHKLNLLIVVNKVDRKDGRPLEARDEVLELLIDLEASDDVLETPVIFASARDGRAALSMSDFESSTSIECLLDAIVSHVKAPKADRDKPFRMAVSQVDYDSYIGRIAIGKVDQGSLKPGSRALRCVWNGPEESSEVKKVFRFEGIGRAEQDLIRAGDIAGIAGIENIAIGDTICQLGAPDRLEPVAIDSPTVAMRFIATNSPFRGREGTYVTSRQLRERLEREARSNVALRVSMTEAADQFEVAGRGILHLGILIEEMRRQGYEFQVSQPKVIERTGPDGERLEPIELCIVDVLESVSGKVIEILGERRGELRSVQPLGSMARLEFEVPARGLIGVRGRLLTATSGEASLNHQFLKYDLYKGSIPQRLSGVQIAHETGKTTTYALEGLEGRGQLFVPAGVDVYEGQIVGEHCRDSDIEVNVCRKKNLTNIRSSSADRKLLLAPPRTFSVEESLEYIGPGELVEITPTSVRLRKVFLKAKDRKKAKMAKAGIQLNI